MVNYLCLHSCVFFCFVFVFCRNVSSDGAEARQRLRECEGLVAALLHALQSAVVNKDTDNKVAKVIPSVLIKTVSAAEFSVFSSKSVLQTELLLF